VHSNYMSVISLHANAEFPSNVPNAVPSSSTPVADYTLSDSSKEKIESTSSEILFQYKIKKHRYKQ